MSYIFAIFCRPFSIITHVESYPPQPRSEATVHALCGGGVTPTDPSKQQSAHCSLAAAPPLNERRLSGKWAELRDLDLCERKEGREGGKNRFGHHLFSPSLPSLFLRTSAPFFLLLFSLSFEWVQRPIKERAAAAAAGWLAGCCYSMKAVPHF